MTRFGRAVAVLFGIYLCPQLSIPPAHSQGENPVVNVIGGTTGIPEGTAGFEKWMMFRDRVAARSKGEISVTPMISGELGSEENILNGLRRGRIQIANLSGLVIGTLVPEVALLQAPYLFDTSAQADHIFDTVLFDIFSELLAPYGLTMFSWDEVGFHHVYSKAPALTPQDLEDVRFRVPSGLAARLFAEALGADVIPLSFNENIIGLQTGLVDAGANAAILYAPTGISEEAPHLTLTGHMLAVNFVISETKWLAGLTPAQRDVIKTGWLPIDQARAMSRAEENGYLDRAEDLGFTLHSLSPSQREAWRTAVAPVTRKMIETIGGRAADIYAAIEEAKQAYQE